MSGETRPPTKQLLDGETEMLLTKETVYLPVIAVLKCSTLIHTESRESMY